MISKLIKMKQIVKLEITNTVNDNEIIDFVIFESEEEKNDWIKEKK